MKFQGGDELMKCFGGICLSTMFGHYRC